MYSIQSLCKRFISPPPPPARIALVLAFALALAGCGGGGGSSGSSVSGGGSSGGITDGGGSTNGGDSTNGGGSTDGGGSGPNLESDLEMVLRQISEPQYSPSPQGGETSDAQAQREADNSFEPESLSPQKTYIPDTQTLRVGSLTSSEHVVIFSSQIEGTLMQFGVYGPDGEEISDSYRSSLSCTGPGTCPSRPDRYDPIFDRLRDNLEDENLYNDDTGAYSVNRQEYEEAFRVAAAAEGFTGAFTHNHLGFEHYRHMPNNSNPIHTFALNRVSAVISGTGTREFQDSFDVALFGRRHPTEADRLDYMDFGVWALNHEDDEDDEGEVDLLVGGLAFGVETSAAAIPTIGSATYNGLVAGLVGPRSGDDTSGMRGVDGDVSIVANFRTNEVTASFSDMQSSAAAGDPTNSIDWHKELAPEI